MEWNRERDPGLPLTGLFTVRPGARGALSPGHFHSNTYVPDVEKGKKSLVCAPSKLSLRASTSPSRSSCAACWAMNCSSGGKSKDGPPLRNLLPRTDVPIGGARLKLQDPVAGTAYSTLSDSDGGFVFDLISPST